MGVTEQENLGGVVELNRIVNSLMIALSVQPTVITQNYWTRTHGKII